MVENLDDILHSVFRIYYNGGKGTAGTALLVQLNNDCIGFITAKHLFPNLRDSEVINFDVINNHCSLKCSGAIYFGTIYDDSAIIVLSEKLFIPLLSLNDLMAEHNFEGDYYLVGDFCIFVGFPFVFNGTFHSLSFENNERWFDQGLLKHGVISGDILDDNNELAAVIIDAHNNAGFSGGPVFVKRQDGYVFIGVICGYYKDKFGGEIKDNTNSGLTVCTGIRCVLAKMERLGFNFEE